jgi:hypothetical protein
VASVGRSCGKGPSCVRLGQFRGRTVSQRFLGHNTRHGRPSYEVAPRGRGIFRAAGRVRGHPPGPKWGSKPRDHSCLGDSGRARRVRVGQGGRPVMTGGGSMGGSPRLEAVEHAAAISSPVHLSVSEITSSAISDFGRVSRHSRARVPEGAQAAPRATLSRSAYRASANSSGSKSRRSSTPSPMPM